MLAGAGVDHDVLVAKANEMLGDMPAGAGAKAVSGAAEYIGKEKLISCPSDVTHVALGFKAVGYNHDDMIYYHALHMMLGALDNPTCVLFCFFLIELL